MDAETTPSLILPPSTPPSVDEVRQCIHLLERFAKDRLLLAGLPENDRIALLTAAGSVVHPDRDAKSRLAKSLRRE
ncbi:MAG: oxidoreductase, partial [Cystobacter sp.]